MGCLISGGVFLQKIRPLLLVAAVILVGFLLRSLSFQSSPLPYNIDGLSELRVSQAILSSHHLDFSALSSEAETYVSDLPVLGLLSAFLSSALGIEPTTSFQLLAAFLGAVTVSIFLLIFRQHWPSSSRGAIASALSLALIGSFVFSAGCTWKETMGFVLVGLALYAFPLRASLPYRALMTFPLLLSPFTHHLVTVVLLVILTFAVIFDFSSKQKNRFLRSFSRNDALDSITVVGMWSLTAFYYTNIHLPYLDFLSPRTDLYLYIAVAFLMMMVAVRVSVGRQPITRLPIELSVPVIGALIMVYSYYHPLFPGLPGPTSLIAVPFLAYLILVVPAWDGAGIVLRTRGASKNLLLAMIFGPLSLILFAFLRSNDATSQLIIYRTFDFLMPAFAILVGLGFAFLVKDRRKLGIVAGFSLVIICASTLPVAYNSQALFGVENQTYWFEYDAVNWFSEHNVSSYTSDQRLGETGWRLFDLDYGRGLPYDLSENLKLNKSSFYVLEDQWSTKGAQEFPFGVVKVAQDTMNTTLLQYDVLYVGGSLNKQITCFST